MVEVKFTYLSTEDRSELQTFLTSSDVSFPCAYMTTDELLINFIRVFRHDYPDNDLIAVELIGW